MGPELRTWQVEGVIREGYDKMGRTWAKNVTLVVYAKTLEEVAAAVRDKYPTIKLIKIIGDRWASDVIVVGRVMEGADSAE